MGRTIGGFGALAAIAPLVIAGCGPGAAHNADGEQEDPPPPVDPCEREPEPAAAWRDGGDDDDAGVPEEALAMPHNVILLMGDGVGAEHWRAAEVEKGEPLAVEALLGPTLYATDSADTWFPTDSAAAATAMATGQCTFNGRLSVSIDNTSLPTVLELARVAGKATGVVTNTVMTDASPMAFASRTFSRYCLDTIVDGALKTRPNVWLGGGLPATAFASDVGLEERARDAGYHVVSGWPLDAEGLPDGGRLLGAFGLDPNPAPWPAWEWGLTPVALRVEPADEPSLADMTELALARLGSAREGFFLFVENEHPDTIGHASPADPIGAAAYLPSAVLELDAAVDQALAWIEAHSSFDETLIMVASDHENGGYELDSATPEGLLTATFSAAPEHTRTPVPLYLRGPGSEHRKQVQHITHLYYLMAGRGDEIPDSPGCP